MFTAIRNVSLPHGFRRDVVHNIVIHGCDRVLQLINSVRVNQYSVSIGKALGKLCSCWHISISIKTTYFVADESARDLSVTYANAETDCIFPGWICLKNSLTVGNESKTDCNKLNDGLIFAKSIEFLVLVIFCRRIFLNDRWQAHKLVGIARYFDLDEVLGRFDALVKLFEQRGEKDHILSGIVLRAETCERANIQVQIRNFSEIDKRPSLS